ncbi:MAG: hypothetical protein HY735_19390 [Verrucomicrobia bacterium]|nr:hypothetical protein [Verrucomicrobiota bacterium]
MNTTSRQLHLAFAFSTSLALGITDLRSQSAADGSPKLQISRAAQQIELTVPAEADSALLLLFQGGDLGQLSTQP